MKKSATDIIPIFPLGIVLFPHTSVPLHIFEERYKELVNACVDHGSEFGILLAGDDELRRVGCAATVSQVLRKYPDGRLDILVEGTRRFHVQEIIDNKSYLEASVVFWREEGVNDQTATPALREAAGLLLKTILKDLGTMLEDQQLEEIDDDKLSFLIAAYGGLTSEKRQHLLELVSARERLEKAVRWVDQVDVEMTREFNINLNGFHRNGKQ